MARRQAFLLEAMNVTNKPGQFSRPAEVCKALLAALDAADGGRRKRKRDQTPDAIGLAIRRDLLKRAVDDEPDPETCEEWLLHCVLTCAPELSGAVSAMARAVFDEW